jgi:indole-3-acetate monooxygenase
MDAAATASIDTLIPTIRARRAEIEDARRLPDDIAAALHGTGIYALSVPRDLGGDEAEPATLMRTIERLAAADGSTGWCAMVGIGNNVAAGYMAPEGAAEVFADPALPAAGIAAPAGKAIRVDGGLRVSGRWPFASGISGAA